jgi:hypothetical protein
MDIQAKLPDMTDEALATLGANAERLARLGSPSQKSAASALLPAIDAELGSRRAVKLEHAKTVAAAAAARRKRPRQ